MVLYRRPRDAALFAPRLVRFAASSVRRCGRVVRWAPRSTLSDGSSNCGEGFFSFIKFLTKLNARGSEPFILARIRSAGSCFASSAFTHNWKETGSSHNSQRRSILAMRPKLSESFVRLGQICSGFWRVALEKTHVKVTVSLQLGAKNWALNGVTVAVLP